MRELKEQARECWWRSLRSRYLRECVLTKCKGLGRKGTISGAAFVTETSGKAVCDRSKLLTGASVWKVWEKRPVIKGLYVHNSVK